MFKSISEHMATEEGPSVRPVFAPLQAAFITEEDGTGGLTLLEVIHGRTGQRWQTLRAPPPIARRLKYGGGRGANKNAMKYNTLYT